MSMSNALIDKFNKELLEILDICIKINMFLNFSQFGFINVNDTPSFWVLEMGDPRFDILQEKF